MGKIIGYALAVIGLIIMAVSLLKIVSIPLVNSSYLTIAGIVLVLAGIILALGKNEKQIEEVPIYSGEGKKRKVVGYKQMGK